MLDQRGNAFGPVAGTREERVVAFTSSAPRLTPLDLLAPGWARPHLADVVWALIQHVEGHLAGPPERARTEQ